MNRSVQRFVAIGVFSLIQVFSLTAVQAAQESMMTIVTEGRNSASGQPDPQTGELVIFHSQIKSLNGQRHNSDSYVKVSVNPANGTMKQQIHLNEGNDLVITGSMTMEMAMTAPASGQGEMGMVNAADAFAPVQDAMEAFMNNHKNEHARILCCVGNHQKDMNGRWDATGVFTKFNNADFRGVGLALYPNEQTTADPAFMPLVAMDLGSTLILY